MVTRSQEEPENMPKQIFISERKNKVRYQFYRWQISIILVKRKVKLIRVMYGYVSITVSISQKPFAFLLENFCKAESVLCWVHIYL